MQQFCGCEISMRALGAWLTKSIVISFSPNSVNGVRAAKAELRYREGEVWA
jgi:hypothetical protein